MKLTTSVFPPSLDTETQSQFYFLSDAVKWGMWPWVPAHIEMAMDFDIDFNRYWIIVRAFGRDHGWDFAYKFPIDAFDMAKGDNWIWDAYPELVQAFRRRDSLPLGEHIHLGEE